MTAPGMPQAERKQFPLIERLRQLAAAHGGPIPEFLHIPNTWDGALSETAREALAIIEDAATLGDRYEQLQRIVAGLQDIRPKWQPIETARDHITPWDQVRSPSTFSFRCLLQNSSGWVCTGEAYYTTAPRSTEQRILRWRSSGRQFFPKYWMPLPAPRIEP